MSCAIIIIIVEICIMQITSQTVALLAVKPAHQIFLNEKYRSFYFLTK